MQPRKLNKKPAERTKQTFYLPVFILFMMCILPFFMMSNVVDYTLMPRFFIMALFISAIALWIFFGNRVHTDLYILKNPLFILLIIFLLQIIFSFFFAKNIKEGYYDLAKWIVFMMVIFTAMTLFKNDGRWLVLMSEFASVSVLALSAIALIQYKIYVVEADSPFLYDGRQTVYAVTGTMSHKNLFSLAFFLMSPWVGFGVFTFKGLWKWISLVSLFLIFLLIFLLQTRAQWLGIFIALPVTLSIFLFGSEKRFLLKKYKKLIFIFITGIVLIGAFVLLTGQINTQNIFYRRLLSIFSPSQNENRIEAWSMTIRMIYDHFFTGVGAGNWKIIFPGYNVGGFSEQAALVWIRTHNDFLWVFSEIGFSGFLVFVLIFVFTNYYLVKCFMHGNREQKTLALLLIWGLTGYVVDSCFDFPYERPFHFFMLGLYMASASVMYSLIKPAITHPKSFRQIWIFISVISFMLSLYAIALIRQEIMIRKCLFDVPTENWGQLIIHGREANSVFKDLDLWANPVITYEAKGLEVTGNTKEALKLYQAAYEINPTKIKGIINLARIYEKNGQIWKALEILNRGIAILPFDKNIRKQKCDLYFKLGMFESVKKNYLSIPKYYRDSVIMNNMRYLDALLKNKQTQHN